MLGVCYVLHICVVIARDGHGDFFVVDICNTDIRDANGVLLISVLTFLECLVSDVLDICVLDGLGVSEVHDDLNVSDVLDGLVFCSIMAVVFKMSSVSLLNVMSVTEGNVAK